MNALAISLQTYFTTFAHTQRDLSINTIVACLPLSGLRTK